MPEGTRTTPVIKKTVEYFKANATPPVKNTREVTAYNAVKAHIEQGVDDMPIESEATETINELLTLEAVKEIPNLIELKEELKDTPIEVIKTDGTTDSIPTNTTVGVFTKQEIETKKQKFIDAFKSVSEQLKEIKLTKQDLIHANNEALAAQFAEAMINSKDLADVPAAFRKIGVAKKVSEIYSDEVKTKMEGAVQDAYDAIRMSDLKPFEKANAALALVELASGHLPGDYTMKLLAKVFGKDFILEMRNIIPVSQSEKFWYVTSQVYNLSRTVLAGFFDFSATLNQLF